MKGEAPLLSSKNVSIGKIQGKVVGFAQIKGG